jgi:hypothetical protein
VFGFSFDTTGPVARDRDVVGAGAAEPRRGLFGRRRAETTTTATTDRTADEPLTAERESVPIAPARTDEREKVTTTTTHRTDEDRS